MDSPQHTSKLVLINTSLIYNHAGDFFIRKQVFIKLIIVCKYFSTDTLDSGQWQWHQGLVLYQHCYSLVFATNTVKAESSNNMKRERPSFVFCRLAPPTFLRVIGLFHHRPRDRQTRPLYPQSTCHQGHVLYDPDWVEGRKQPCPKHSTLNADMLDLEKSFQLNFKFLLQPV